MHHQFIAPPSISEIECIRNFGDTGLYLSLFNSLEKTTLSVFPIGLVTSKVTN